MKKNYNTDNTTTIFLLGILIILIGVALYLFFIKDNNGKETFNNKPIHENLKLEFFSMKGCGHCENFKSIWKDIEKSEIGSYTIHIGPDDPDYNNKCKQYSIRGFPHIQLTKNGVKISEYSGARNLISIINWFKENLNI